MNPQKLIIVILATLSAIPLALADDFKTINGKEYKDASVTHVEPDGIVVKTKSGISKVYFVELPKEVQQRFNYNPQQAAAYSAAEAANYVATQNQQQKDMDERQRQQNAAAAQGAQVQAAWNRSRELQDRYLMLQQQENSLAQQVVEVAKLGKRHHSELKALEGALMDVREEKKRISDELNKTQR